MLSEFSRLPCEFSTRLGYQETEWSPTFDFAETGVRIHIPSFSFERPSLRFDLAVTYQVARAFHDRFYRLSDGLVYLIEDCALGRCACGQFIDPYGRRPHTPDSTPNYQPTRAAKQRTGAICGYIQASFQLELPEAPRGDELFVSVFLLDQVSNKLAVDLRRGTVSSYYQGRPYDVRFADLSEDAS